MKQLILKELKEHAKLGIPALAAVMCIIYPFVNFYRSGHSNSSQPIFELTGVQPLLAPLFLNGVALTLTLFGLILGWRQIQNDKQPDLWAFLIHRPLSKKGIFWSKVIAGLSLYFAFTTFPLLLFVIYVRGLGRDFFPFEWEMALPLAANILAGVLWYFVGALSGLRKARKSGTATAPFIAGLILNLLAIQSFQLPQFYQAALILIFGIALLGTAAWGSFLQNGELQCQPLPARISLAGTLTLFGLTLLWISGALLSIVSGDSVQRANDLYTMRKDGVITRTRVETNQLWKITGLDGEEMKDPKTGQAITTLEVSQNAAPRTWLPGQYQLANFVPNWQTPETFFEQWDNINGVRWLWTRHHGLAGYDPTGKLITTIAPSSPANGARIKNRAFLKTYNPMRVPRSSFPFLATSTDVQKIDLGQKTSTIVYSCKSTDSIHAIMPMPKGQIGVAQDQSIVILDADGKELKQLPIKPEWNSATLELFTLEKPETFALWVKPRTRSRWDALISPDSEVYYYGQGVDGERRLIVPALPTRETPFEDKAFIIANPLLALVIASKWTPVPGLYLLLSFLGGLILCLPVSILVGRRYQFSARAQWGWALFFLAFGIAGLVVFFGMRDWPFRVRCDGCGKKRPIDREHCGHCGATFEPAKATGVEIFEPTAAHG